MKPKKKHLKWVFISIVSVLLLFLIFGGTKHLKLEGFKENLDYKTERLKIISNESYTYNPEERFIEIKQIEEGINKIEFDIREVLGNDNSSFDAEMVLFYLENTYFGFILQKPISLEII